MEITITLIDLLVFLGVVGFGGMGYALYRITEANKRTIRELVEKHETTVLEEIKKGVDEHIEQLPPQPVRVVDPEREVYANSPTPWVKLVGILEDAERGIEVKLDWNDAFVNELKEKGYVGIDDNQMVQKWLVMLTMNVAQDMNDEAFAGMLAEPDVDIQLEDEDDK